MALFEFKLPDIGEGVAEGEVVAWHVEPGQIVAEDQEMVEVMTDKATVTIGAPKAGRISALHAQVGEKVPVGAVLVVIDTDGKVGDAPKARAPEHDKALSKFQAPAKHRAEAERHSMRAIEGASAKKDEGPAATAVGDIRESLPGTSFFASKSQNGHGGAARAVEVEAAASSVYYSDRPLATPATRKLARDVGVDLRRVPPTGPGGRVTKDDVRAFSGAAGTAMVSSHAPQRERSVPSEMSALEERKPFVGLRRRIAEKMQTATRTAAHFTFVEEVEVDALKQSIDRLRPMADRAGVKLNYLPFIVKAVTLALKKHPILNSMLDEQKNELVVRRYYHIGIAAATDQGLMVPVLRDADRMSTLEIARGIQHLGDGARKGTLKPQELSGSTFTITSLGKQGGLLATPVLNHPEVGILGVHRVKEKPVVRGGQIVVGQVMLLSLSFDHRIIDGHVGAAFAYDVIAYLETPDLLLLELA
jgi:pyruvate dehydrogenase E2 component (dihydrolipoamide acetyltransferase)